MTGIQILLLVIFAAAAAASAAALARGRSVLLSLGTLFVSLTACAAVIWPDSTTRIAQALGIDRGKDLLLYCSVVVMMAGFYLFYIRLRQLRRDVTLMVRHVALLEARENVPAGSDDESAGREGGEA